MPKDLGLQKSFLQTIEPLSPTYKNYYPLRKLFGDYFDKLNVPYHDVCCPERTGTAFPIRYNSSGDVIETFNGTDWIPLSGALGGDIGNNEVVWSDNGTLVGDPAFYFLPLTHPSANSGVVNVVYTGGLGPEVGFRYSGDDIGFVRNDINNSYSGLASGAAAGLFITCSAFSKFAQLYLGTPSNAFVPDGFLLNTGGYMKLNASGYIDFCIGALGGQTVNERMRITNTGAAIGNTAPTVPDASAILDLQSTTSSLVLPRMTKTQRNAISAPLAGSAVYQTDNTPGLRVYNGTNWMRFTETSDA